MRTTIDDAGRIVVPKAIRDQLALHGGQELEVSTRDGHIEIEVPATSMRLEDRDGVAVAVTDWPMPLLTQELVREYLERVRR
jgi:AbrB family looped-hinge helix DNA binding protein